MTEDITAVLRRAADRQIREYDPGDIERRGMRLRRTRQRTTALVVGVFVLALSVSSITAVQAWRSQRPTAPAASTPAAPSPGINAPLRREFIPATHTESGYVVMPVTFLDGSTAEVVYPADLDLAGMGADPYGSGTLYEPPLDCCARDFLFAYGEPFLRAPAGKLLKEYPGADGGSVRLLQNPGAADYLVFEIGEWRLGVWNNMSDETRALWSANLRGRVSVDGFPVLAATPPVRLTQLGQAYGPSLEFGHLDGSSVRFSPTRTCPPNYVEPRADQLPDGVSTPVLCRPEWSMLVNITGDRTFAERIINTLQVRSVHLAGN
jgi:hypothetical protein